MENNKIKKIIKKYFITSVNSTYYYCTFTQKYRWNKISGIEVQEVNDIWVPSSWHKLYVDISTYEQNRKQKKRKEQLLVQLNKEAIDKLLNFNFDNTTEESY